MGMNCVVEGTMTTQASIPRVSGDDPNSQHVSQFFWSGVPCASMNEPNGNPSPPESSVYSPR